jgi:hypothetical protein
MADIINQTQREALAEIVEALGNGFIVNTQYRGLFRRAQIESQHRKAYGRD